MKFSCRLLSVCGAFIGGLYMIETPWIGLIALVSAVALFAMAEQADTDE